ncbi:MAG: cytochrome c [Chloroflexi bacterium]|uniref:Cytochrome c n=1 Tax=Candidatus Chlorohelix allophototropha TaxID=3003348 RepID=A0A8T7M1C2_9CHLR|nr:cytochrome c [Chloroflexota bacterium]WJW67656.1 cytochrome c [Chloroflexota bacterium L227-S17]
MHLKGKLLRLSWVLPLVVLVLVACGDNGTVKTTATPEVREAPKAATTAAATTAAQAASTTAAQVAATTTAAATHAATTPAAGAATTPAAGATTDTAAETTDVIWQPTVTPVAAPGDITRGSQIFRRTCQVCHAKGGTETGTYGQPNLAEQDVDRKDPSFVRQIIRSGKKGTITPGIDMPTWTPDLIRDNELEDLVAYVVSLQYAPAGYTAPTPTALPTILATPTAAPTRPAPTPPNGADGNPIVGSAIRGDVIFRNSCQRCHASGGRTLGPKNQPNHSLGANTWNPNYVRSFVYNGSPTWTLMPPFGPNLTPQELEDVVKYVTTINTTLKPATPTP